MNKKYLKLDQTIKNDISSLYLSAFPDNERPPLDYFYKAINRYESNVVIGYYDKNDFIGFVYLTYYKDIIYVVYFAISEEKRNKGYGSFILKDIKDCNPNYTILLCYEEVDEKYSDYELRKRRENFYKRNGFVPNHLKAQEGPVIYQSAYSGNHLVNYVDYKAIFDLAYGPGTSDIYLKEYKK